MLLKPPTTNIYDFCGLPVLKGKTHPDGAKHLQTTTRYMLQTSWRLSPSVWG